MNLFHDPFVITEATQRLVLLDPDQITQCNPLLFSFALGDWLLECPEQGVLFLWHTSRRPPAMLFEPIDKLFCCGPQLGLFPEATLELNDHTPFKEACRAIEGIGFLSESFGIVLDLATSLVRLYTFERGNLITGLNIISVRGRDHG